MPRLDVSLPPGSLTIADLTLDFDNYRVHRGDVTIDLPPCEMAILAVLAINRGRLVRYAEIVHKVWGYDGETTAELLKAQVCHLRRKLGLKAGSIVLQTRICLGYRLDVETVE